MQWALSTHRFELVAMPRSVFSVLLLLRDLACFSSRIDDLTVSPNVVVQLTVYSSSARRVSSDFSSSNLRACRIQPTSSTSSPSSSRSLPAPSSSPMARTFWLNLPRSRRRSSSSPRRPFALCRVAARPRPLLYLAISSSRYTAPFLRLLYLSSSSESDSESSPIRFFSARRSSCIRSRSALRDEPSPAFCFSCSSRIAFRSTAFRFSGRSSLCPLLSSIFFRFSRGLSSSTVLVATTSKSAGNRLF